MQTRAQQPPKRWVIPVLSEAIKAKQLGYSQYEAYRAAKQKLEKLALDKAEYEYAIDAICRALKM